MEPTAAYPRVATLGVTGFLVTFGAVPEDGANRAALAFRAALDAAAMDGVEETATSLVSVLIRFDPLRLSHDQIRHRIEALLGERDWRAADPPPGRFWRIPAVFGGAEGPQLAEAADLAGQTPEAAIETLCAAPVNVLTLGFAPGQPYMGMLPRAWDIPRQGGLTPRVPKGAIVVAVRQLIIFSNDTPTGWRHVGQCGFHPFRPEAEVPFALTAGDRVQFLPVTAAELAARIADCPDGMGGATCENLP